jgi:hypothetical protein
MIDPIEEVLAPAVIERAMSIFESFRDRDRVDIVQARKAVTQHVFGLIGSGQSDDRELVVSALICLKSLEARGDQAKKVKDVLKQG